MKVIFVHGWSVTNTNTYGDLPKVIASRSAPELNIEVTNLYLGKYISFSDAVTIDDIARGMQQAVEDEVRLRLSARERFACITHSTGGPVVRKWIDLFYRKLLRQCPLSHLIMLAPANHGSALAQLGKGRLSRMKFLTEGVEPGTGVLDWLELGSGQSWELNCAWLDYQCTKSGLYNFVLTGQSIDRSLYDHLNSYTGEAGSDGVVRVAAANMNYGYIKLIQRGTKFELSEQKQTEESAFGVLPKLSHSDKKMGIMRSVKENSTKKHETVEKVLQCLRVTDVDSYKKLKEELSEFTDDTQEQQRSGDTEDSSAFVIKRKFPVSRYCMFIFRIVDDRGNQLSDYDLFFTAGPKYSKNDLPKGFFIDRQRNQLNPGMLTYYVDYDKIEGSEIRKKLKDKFGFIVSARPSTGYAHYTEARYEGTFEALKEYFQPNQTLMIEIQLTRHVRSGVFQLTQDLEPTSFKRQPAGGELQPVEETKK